MNALHIERKRPDARAPFLTDVESWQAFKSKHDAADDFLTQQGAVFVSFKLADNPTEGRFYIVMASENQVSHWLDRNWKHLQADSVQVKAW